jgi:hypothetical protein
MICRGLRGAGRPVLGCPGRAARAAAPRAAQDAFGAPAALGHPPAAKRSGRGCHAGSHSVLAAVDPAQAVAMRLARTGPMPSTSRRRSGSASMTSNTFSPKARSSFFA